MKRTIRLILVSFCVLTIQACAVVYDFQVDNVPKPIGVENVKAKVFYVGKKNPWLDRDIYLDSNAESKEERNFFLDSITKRSSSKIIFTDDAKQADYFLNIGPSYKAEEWTGEGKGKEECILWNVSLFLFNCVESDIQGLMIRIQPRLSNKDPNGVFLVEAHYKKIESISTGIFIYPFHSIITALSDDKEKRHGLAKFVEPTLNSLLNFIAAAEKASSPPKLKNFKKLKHVRQSEISRDKGKTWELIKSDSGLPPGWKYRFASNQNDLYAQGDSIFHSSDSGLSWSELELCDEIGGSGSLVHAFRLKNALVLAVECGYYVSRDGHHFQKVDKNRIEKYFFSTVAVLKDQLIGISQEEKVYALDEQKLSWNVMESYSGKEAVKNLRELLQAEVSTHSYIFREDIEANGILLRSQ